MVNGTVDKGNSDEVNGKDNNDNNVMAIHESNKEDWQYCCDYLSYLMCITSRLYLHLSIVCHFVENSIWQQC